MLTEMTRQVLHLQPQLREMLHASIAGIESRSGQVAAKGVSGIDELELVHHFRKTIDHRLIDPEDFSYFSGRTASTICDHVGSHRGAVLPVFLVDVLNHTLAPIAARQIDVDVGPLA